MKYRIVWHDAPNRKIIGKEEFDTAEEAETFIGTELMQPENEGLEGEVIEVEE